MYQFPAFLNGLIQTAVNIEYFDIVLHFDIYMSTSIIYLICFSLANNKHIPFFNVLCCFTA